MEWITDGFNSSVGILVVRTTRAHEYLFLLAKVSIPRSEFWSFGRGSGIQYPSSESGFQFLGRNSGRSDKAWLRQRGFNVLVSIPRSEFWSFGHDIEEVAAEIIKQFQFLGRNSGRSDEKALKDWGVEV